MGGAHRRIGRGDDRHAVSHVSSIKLAAMSISRNSILSGLP